MGRPLHRKGGVHPYEAPPVITAVCPTPCVGEKLAIVQKADAGGTVRQVAKEFGVDPKSVRYWQRQKMDLEGQLSGGAQKGTHVSAIPAQYEQSLGVWLQMEETRGSNVTYAMIVDKLRVHCLSELCTVLSLLVTTCHCLSLHSVLSIIFLSLLSHKPVTT